MGPAMISKSCIDRERTIRHGTAWRDSLEGDPCRADDDDVAVEGDSRLVRGDVGTAHINTEEISRERNAKTESIT